MGTGSVLVSQDIGSGVQVLSHRSRMASGNRGGHKAMAALAQGASLPTPHRSRPTHLNSDKKRGGIFQSTDQVA